MNVKRTNRSCMMCAVTERLHQVIETVPAGCWVVGVSGGADSTALLRLLHGRADLRLIVAHLNHETRGEASDGDEQFVHQLADELGCPFESRRLSELDAHLRNAPANPSARYRFARFVHFRETIEKHTAAGVILAHHAMDQAETVFQRLLRGSGYTGLTGISGRAIVQGVHVVRPLLPVHPIFLREYLRSLKQTWREDASNQSDVYERNRVRKMLTLHPSICDALDDLRRECRALHAWVKVYSPLLDRKFAAKELATLPLILARQSAAKWLSDAGCPRDELVPEVLDRLILMTRDASTPARQVFPANVMVHRKAGWIEPG